MLTDAPGGCYPPHPSGESVDWFCGSIGAYPKRDNASSARAGRGATARIPAVLQTEIYSLKSELLEIKATQQSILDALAELTGKKAAPSGELPPLRIPGQLAKPSL